jgi:hypothetical protein
MHYLNELARLWAHSLFIPGWIPRRSEWARNLTLQPIIHRAHTRTRTPWSQSSPAPTSTILEFRMALARVSWNSPLRLLASTFIQSSVRPFRSSVSTVRRSAPRSFPIAAVLSKASPYAQAVREEGEAMKALRPVPRRTWKPTCLYYTQGKCTMVRLIASLSCHVMGELLHSVARRASAIVTFCYV